MEAHLAALERFASDVSDLEELERAMAEFDAFAFLGLSSSEEMHSNVLAWLLDPGKNHSLGDFLLKRFLLETGAVSHQEMGTCEWSNASVEREWHNVVDGEIGYLDILVVNQDVEFACAIENKIFSGEHGGQLSHHKRAMERLSPITAGFTCFCRPAAWLLPLPTTGNSGHRRATPPFCDSLRRLLNWPRKQEGRLWRRSFASMPRASGGPLCPAVSCGERRPRYTSSTRKR